MYWIFLLWLIFFPTIVFGSENNLVSNVETNSKIMMTSISENEDHYQYKVTLVWKKIPVVRSYDIIGIGFYKNLKVSSDLYFVQEYCFVDGRCSEDFVKYPQIFDLGIGVVFKLPVGDLISLKQTLYFDVEKKIDTTITVQDIYGDYAHAIKDVQLDSLFKYKIILSLGIILDSDSVDCYDNISVGKASLIRDW